MIDFFYLQHGKPGEPMRTERVYYTTRMMATPRKRGDAIPTYWVVRWNGRAYRVWNSETRGRFIRSKHGADGIIRLDVFS